MLTDAGYRKNEFITKCLPLVCQIWLPTKTTSNVQ